MFFRTDEISQELISKLKSHLNSALSILLSSPSLVQKLTQSTVNQSRYQVYSSPESPLTKSLSSLLDLIIEVISSKNVQ